jgi:hypothetical protein
VRQSFVNEYMSGSGADDIQQVLIRNALLTQSIHQSHSRALGCHADACQIQFIHNLLQPSYAVRIVSARAAFGRAAFGRAAIG